MLSPINIFFIVYLVPKKVTSTESNSILLESSSIHMDSTYNSNEECHPTVRNCLEECHPTKMENLVALMNCLEELVNSLATVCNIQNKTT